MSDFVFLEKKSLLLPIIVFAILSSFFPTKSYADQTPQNPVVIFSSDIYSMAMGEISLVPVSVKNLDSSQQNYRLELSSPSELQFWVWFDGHRYDTSRANVTMQFQPNEQKTLFLGVFGGSPGSYQLKMKATSLNNGQFYLSSATINVNPSDTSVFTPTPESSLLFFYVIVFALLLVGLK